MYAFCVYVCENERMFVCLRVREGVRERGVCVCVNVECACVRMRGWVGG